MTVGVVPPPRSAGVYTNTSSRPHRILFKVAKGPRPQFLTIDALPGQTFEIPSDQVESFERTPTFRSGEFKRGRVAMPRPKTGYLTKADPTLALRFIANETNVMVLKEWLKKESRQDIIFALSERLRALAPG